MRGYPKKTKYTPGHTFALRSLAEGPVTKKAKNADEEVIDEGGCLDAADPGNPTGMQCKAPGAKHLPMPVDDGPFALAARSDAPPVSFTTRGSSSLAISTTMTAKDREEAMEEYRRDKFAITAGSVRSAAWATWCRFHTHWFGEELDPLPLTARKVEGVLCVFKRGRYRSVGNYLSVAKATHIKAGHAIGDQLKQEMKDGKRSVLRGIGPSHQCEELPLKGLCEACSAAGVDLMMKAEAFARMVIIGCFFILREVECSLMLHSSVTLDRVAKRITIWLPATKSDPCALTCQRSWGCVCHSPADEWCCPFHAGCMQYDYVLEQFGSDGALPSRMPFFPTVSGSTVPKQHVISMVIKVATVMGLAIYTLAGRLAFTGHVFRITGSRMLARHGVQVAVIMLLARWQSDTVLGYIKEVPLEYLTTDFRNRTATSASGKAIGSKGDPSTSSTSPIVKSSGGSSSSGSKVDASAAIVDSSTSATHMISRRFDDKMLKSIEALASEFKQQKHEQLQLIRRIEEIEASKKCNTSVPLPWELEPYVISYDGEGSYHKVVIANTNDPSEWITKCGWRFAMSPHKRSKEVPEELHFERLCDRCLRQLRKDHMARTLSADPAHEEEAVSSDSSA